MRCNLLHTQPQDSPVAITDPILLATIVHSGYITISLCINMTGNLPRYLDLGDFSGVAAYWDSGEPRSAVA